MGSDGGRTIARIKLGALWIDKQKEITIRCHINETASNGLGAAINKNAPVRYLL